EEKPQAEIRPASAAGFFAMAICLILTVVIGVTPGRWIAHAHSAGASIRQMVAPTTAVRALTAVAGPASRSMTPNIRPSHPLVPHDAEK
ncbi:MAG TPA: hypothetical protein PL064_14595, partial [Thermogutta sp.]|nr:hypothetical protein [Thermogutta sp.]